GGARARGGGAVEPLVKVSPRDARSCGVSVGGGRVAAGFLSGSKTPLELPWASPARRYNRLSANMLLYSSALDYACREGYEVFDFGRSTPHSGTYRFKEQWGARPVPLYWYHWSRDGRPVPDVSPANAQYDRAIQAWQSLPR